MEPVRTVHGTMLPLPRADVDTDQIIPKQFLKRIERTGYGQFLFFDWAQDPAFVLNRPEHRQARVLVAGPNFGCGSSREHAPWALQQWGFQAVIAPSFADIFRTNCHKNGLLPVVLSPAEVDHLLRLASDDPDSVIEIDLADQTVGAQGLEARFDIDPFVKRCLLEGLDDIALTLAHEEAIGAFERARPSWKLVLRS